MKKNGSKDLKDDQKQVSNESGNETQDNAASTQAGEEQQNTEDLSANDSESNCTDEKTELLYKMAELNDKFLRLHSEFDNYRKRTIKEKNDLAKFATGELITELLPVFDDFERALKSMQKTPETEPIVQGVELVYNKLFKILENQGLKPLNSIGEVFDTDFHEAITKVTVEDDEQKGRVFDEVQKGYTLNDKVIRYAKVVVAE